jgi:mono/diheme cytochrome c family protein
MQRLACLIAVLLGATPALANAQGDAGEKPGSSTVSEAQAQRGEIAFKANCANCHTVKQFTTPDFVKTWNERPVFDLFEQLRVNMPQDNPGKLTRQQYIDVVTYLLKSNGAASGEQEMSAEDDAMKAAKVKLKGSGG